METAGASSGEPDPAATIAMLRRALERMPGNVDAMVGLAGMHLRLGMIDAAADWCSRAAAIAPRHAPVARVRAAIDDAYVKRGLHEVIDGRMRDAIDTFSRAAAWTDGGAAGLYRALFGLTSRWFDEASGLPPESDAIRLSLPVWGADYVAAAMSGLLRSPLAPGNLPALARSRAVRLEIGASAADRTALESSPALAAIKRYAAVDFFTFPDHLLVRPGPPDFFYWLMPRIRLGSADRGHAHHPSCARRRRSHGARQDRLRPRRDRDREHALRAAGARRRAG